LLKSGLVRLAVRQTLARRGTNSKGHPFPVIETKGGAVIEPKIVFGKIAVQMFLGAMLVNALHAPLEDRKVAFN
jgi:hypothetical protein